MCRVIHKKWWHATALACLPQQQVFACAGSTRGPLPTLLGGWGCLGQCQNKISTAPATHISQLCSEQGWGGGAPSCFLKAAQNADSAASRRLSYRYRIGHFFGIHANFSGQHTKKFSQLFTYITVWSILLPN